VHRGEIERTRGDQAVGGAECGQPASLRVAESVGGILRQGGSLPRQV
jgi:hypothetical protein